MLYRTITPKYNKLLCELIACKIVTPSIGTFPKGMTLKYKQEGCDATTSNDLGKP